MPPLTGNLQSLILLLRLWYFASTIRNRTHKTTLGGMGVSVSQAHAKLNKASWRGEADRRMTRITNGHYIKPRNQIPIYTNYILLHKNTSTQTSCPTQSLQILDKNFSNRKWADKNSSKQFLWTKNCVKQEIINSNQQSKEKLRHVVQICVCRLT